MLQNLASTLSDIVARNMRAVCFLVVTSLVGSAWAAENSQTVSTTVISSTPAHSTAPTSPLVKKMGPVTRSMAKVTAAKPLWTDLTPAQQQALSPLSTDWDKLDQLRKQKWLALANKFPGMKPEEQQRVQDRMRDWVKLTPAQRRAARESYARAKKLNAEQKSEKWQQYQNLPEEEKKKLAAEAKNKKHLANLPRQNANKNKVSTSIKSVSKPRLAPPVAQQPATSQPVTPPASSSLAPTPTK